MTKPQQPELARSRLGPTDESGFKSRDRGPSDETAPTGHIPEDNLPGHRPDEDQDKPAGPPPRPRARRVTTPKGSQKVEGEAKATITDLGANRRAEASRTFKFAFEPLMTPFAYALGITPWTTRLDVRDGKLSVRFGAWRVETPLDNVEGATVTGPYSLVKVAGPPHLSFADRGLTMATSTKQGVCIRFRDPVSVLLPKSLLRHPALTVTVEDPEALAELLNDR